MATLNVLTKTNVDAAVPEYWAPSILREADRDSLFSRLSGPEGSKAPVVEKRDLITKPGDKITFTITGRLVGKGRTGSATLEGNEEKLRIGTFAVTVDQVRHATAADYIATVQAIFDFSKTSRAALSGWVTRKLDDQVMEQVLVTDTIKSLFAGGKTSRNNLSSGDFLNPPEMKKLHVAAQRRGIMATQKVKFGKMDWPVYMAALSEADYYQLTSDPDFKSDARLAAMRGKGNPVLSGMIDMYEGLMLFVFPSINQGDGVVGSFLRPEAVLATALTAAATTVVTGDSSGSVVTNVDYWQYFPIVGALNKLRIDSEILSYDADSNGAPGDSSLASVTRGVAGGVAATTHSVGALITLNNLGRVLIFGPEFLMRAWGRDVNNITQFRDYGEELGLGLRYINGVKGTENVDAALRSAIVMETYSPATSTI